MMCFSFAKIKQKKPMKLCGPILMEKNMTHHVLELFPVFEGVCFFAVLIASHPSSYLSVFLAAKRSEGS